MQFLSDFHWFHEFFYILEFFFFFTNADDVKVKDETSKKNLLTQWR